MTIKQDLKRGVILRTNKTPQTDTAFMVQNRKESVQICGDFGFLISVPGLFKRRGKALSRKADGLHHVAGHGHMRAFARNAIILTQYPYLACAIVELIDTRAQRTIGLGHVAAQCNFLVVEMVRVLLDLVYGRLCRTTSDHKHCDCDRRYNENLARNLHLSALRREYQILDAELQTGVYIRHSMN